MRKPVVLRIYRGEQLFGVKQFLDEQIVIGRQSEVQVSLNDEKVALIHAVIEDRDGNFYVSDLGSESGTFRNGEAVLDARIDSGDTLVIGDFRIEFYVGVPKPKVAPPPPPVPNQAMTAETVVAVQATEPTMVGSAPKIPEQPSDLSPVAATVPEPAQQASTVVAASAAAATTAATASAAPVVSAVSSGTATTFPATGVAGSADVDPFKIAVPPVVSSADVVAAAGTSPVHAKVAPPRLNPLGPVSKRRHKKSGGTFAPPSKYQSFREFVKPSKGTVVEVLVLWRERIINTSHFSRKATITMGSHPSCDIVLPVMLSRQRKVPLLQIDARAVVLVSPEMTGELIKGQQSSSFAELLRQNRLIKDATSYSIVLDQGEMVRLELTDQVSIIIRYTSDSPKPLVAPLLDLTAAEFTGVVMALVLVGILSLYMLLVTPPSGLNDESLDDPMRTAVIELEQKKRPKPPPPPPVEEVKPVAPRPTPPATPPPAKSTPSPVKMDKKPKQRKAQNPDPKPDPGAASNVAPNRNDKKAPRTRTSIKQGGAVKTGKTEGAQAKSQRRDVGKAGVFSVFGTNGRQDRLDSTYNGAGELSGFADAATGRAGQNEDRPGEGLGTPFKDTGRGGTGTASVGVAGVNTRGRGSGNSGFGMGGLGDRKGVKIVPGGEEESFSGTIDKEAIRRAVRANIRAIKACYERELNRNPDLFGKIVIEWVIAEQGRVPSARVKSNELGNARVGGCVRDIIRVIHFPEPPANEEVTVAYPFFFSN